MDNISGELKGYEKMADNYIDEDNVDTKNLVIEKVDKKVDKKEAKKLVGILAKNYKLMEDNLNKLRELKAHKELYDASTSLNNFKESFEKISMIYN